MGGFKAVRPLAVALITLGLSTVVLGCKITENSGPEPYLVRIIECLNLTGFPYSTDPNAFTGIICSENLTVAHGSLIAPDKVLSTCAWNFLRSSPLPTRFRVYDQGQKCFQERSRQAAILHRDCSKDSEIFQRNDYGLWIMDQPFDITMNALLWRGQWGGLRPPKWNELKDVIKEISDKKSTCTTGVFKNDSDIDEQQQQSKLQIIPWSTCAKDFEKIYPGDGYSSMVMFFREIGMYTYLCVEDDLPKEVFPVLQVLNIDWYAGAAVVCDVDGKKVPVGMLSQAVNPPPYVPKRFRVAVIFDPKFYMFLSDNVGIEPEPGDNVTEDCKLSGKNLFPYLLRIMKTGSGFDPFITVGHGAVIKKNLVLSSCAPYKDLPTELQGNKDWTFWGYNRKKQCVQRRRPRVIYKHKDCTKPEPGRLMVNDFAIWEPTKEFALDEFDLDSPYPNLWEGPGAPPYPEVVRSITELSDAKYVGIISRRLSVGVFIEPNKFSEDLQIDAEVQFVPWADCKPQLERFDNKIGLGPVAPPGEVKDTKIFPLFCGYESFSPTSPESNVSTVDYFSGAILRYSFLYVFDWGEQPSTRTYPLGLLSSVYRGKAGLDDAANIRIVSVFGKDFYEFLDQTDRVINPIPHSGQTPRSSTSLASVGLGLHAMFLVGNP